MQKAPLAQGSDSFKRWSNINVPIYFNVYVFNVTNADDVANGLDTNVTLQELGPYVFREKKERDVLDNLDSEIKYQPINNYEFDEEMSNGLTLNDTVTFANVPFMGMSKKIQADIKADPKSPSNFAQSMIVAFAEKVGERAFMTRTVRELLFDGYVDPLVQKLYDISKGKMPEILPNNTFGLFYGKNGQPAEGDWTIDRGTSDVQNIGKVRVWNNLT